MLSSSGNIKLTRFPIEPLKKSQGLNLRSGFSHKELKAHKVKTRSKGAGIRGVSRSSFLSILGSTIERLERNLG